MPATDPAAPPAPDRPPAPATPAAHGHPATRAVLWWVPAVYLVFVAAEFAAMTHAALTATAAGHSAFRVGLLGTALWSGILVSSAVAHRWVAGRGHARVFFGATLLSTLALLGLALLPPLVTALPTGPGPAQALASAPPLQPLLPWLAGAAVLGLGGGLVWVAGEAWLAEAAPPARRGFYVGLFETAVGLGLMLGPALVPLGRLTGVPVPAMAALLMLLALACSARLLRVPQPGTGGVAEAAAATAPSADSASAAQARATAGRDRWRRQAGPLVAVAAVSGLMEAGVSSLLPSVSMRLGFSVEAAAWLGTVIGAGSALLQPPAGHLADRIGVRRAVLGVWAGVLATTALLLAVAQQPGAVLWAAGFALGGLGGAVYTLLIIELGHRLAGAALVRAIGALVIGYAAGTAAGPALGGALFDTGGLPGLAGLLLVLAAAGTGATAVFLRRA